MEKNKDDLMNEAAAFEGGAFQEEDAEPVAAQGAVLSPEDLVVKLNQEKEKYDALMEKFQRTMADYDNFRKRTAKEKAGAYNDGIVDTIEKLLPVVDNFERALNAAPDKDDSIYKGILMIYKQMEEALGQIGVKPIVCQGEAFDPNLHYAVMHEEDENYENNVIIEEMQKGYTFQERVIRPSMVKVAN